MDTYLSIGIVRGDFWLSREIDAIIELESNPIVTFFWT